MLKKNIFGKHFIVLTNEQFKLFAQTGTTYHDEDNRRFYIIADEKGFPVVDRVEWLKEAQNENPVVTWSTKADYVEAGLKPYNPNPVK